MVFIVLRSGKVLQYNKGETIAVEDGCVTVRGAQKTDSTRYLVARIPLDIVERAEFQRPCRVLKAKSISRVASYEQL